MQKPLSKEHEVAIPLGIIFSLVTCGLYNVYWNYKEMGALNELLGRKEYDFTHWLLLSLVTCGLYHVYYEYKMGQDLAERLKAFGHDANPNLAYVGLALSLCGLWVVTDAIYQHEINKLVA